MAAGDSRQRLRADARAAAVSAGMHRPRKRFGQHFLVDQAVIDSILREISPQPGQRVVEIGPGLAALTQPLLDRLGQLTVIELDRDLAAGLRGKPGLNVVQADALGVDFTQLAATLADQAARPEQTQGRLRLVGNLPYNISSPLLFHLLGHVSVIEDQHFMLQREVVDRMVALPSTSAYGRLSVMLQWRYAMERVLLVAPEAFDPPPRVDSAVVRMRPREDAVNLGASVLSDVVRVAFSQRRKLLRHSLGQSLEQWGFQGQFDLQRRAEEVPVAEYLALTLQLPRRPGPVRLDQPVAD